MKFQNPSFNFFLNGRKDERTNERTSRNQYAPHCFKVGGILFFFWGGGGGGGVEVDVNEELKFLGKFTKKKFGWGGGVAKGVRWGGGGGVGFGQGGCERNVGGRG